MPSSDASDTKTSMQVTYGSVESPIKASVTVIEDGYLDDSIRGARFRLDFTRDGCDDCGEEGGPWRVVAYHRDVRCWPGRGHDDVSPDPCV